VDEVVNETDMSNMLSDRGSTYFEIMAEFCFFENVDTNYKQVCQNGKSKVISDKSDHNTSGMI
jgi:hypothetical protein